VTQLLSCSLFCFLQVRLSSSSEGARGRRGFSGVSRGNAVCVCTAPSLNTDLSDPPPKNTTLNLPLPLGRTYSRPTVVELSRRYWNTALRRRRCGHLMRFCCVTRRCLMTTTTITSFSMCCNTAETVTGNLSWGSSWRRGGCRSFRDRNVRLLLLRNCWHSEIPHRGRGWCGRCCGPHTRKTDRPWSF